MPPSTWSDPSVRLRPPASPNLVTAVGGDVQASPPSGPGPADGALDRRRALGQLLGVAATVLLWPWRLAHAKKVGLQLSQVPQLGQVGGSAVVTVKGQELLLIRASQTAIKALDPMCTHKKCKVFFRPKDHDIGCKCHKSQFTLDGKPVSGPAKKPLGSFAAKLKGEMIVIDLP